MPNDDDYTPVPTVEFYHSPLVAELDMARAQCKRQQLELAVKQAVIDEQAAEIRQLYIDRRALAAWVQQLKKGNK